MMYAVTCVISSSMSTGRPDRALDTVYQALATFRELAEQDPASGRATIRWSIQR